MELACSIGRSSQTRLFEEPCSLHIDAHGSEHDGEVVLVVVNDCALRAGGAAHETRLTTDLRSDLVVGQTSGGEDGDLLTSEGMQ